MGIEAGNRRKSNAFIQTAQLCIKNFLHNIINLVRYQDKIRCGFGFQRSWVPKTLIYRQSSNGESENARMERLSASLFNLGKSKVDLSEGSGGHKKGGLMSPLLFSRNLLRNEIGLFSTILTGLQEIEGNSGRLGHPLQLVFRCKIITAHVAGG